MPSTYTIEAEFVDVCFADFLTDHTGILVGIEVYGQTREEMVDEAADEAYSDDEFPLGDTCFDALKAAVKACIKTDARFWPVDNHGNSVTDKYAEIADEQPCAWFRITVTSKPMPIILDNQGSDDGSVTVTCDESDAANDQTIDGSTWENCDGMAYTILSDRPSLYDELVAEGYDVDASAYSPPDDADMARWHAKYLAEGGR